MRKGEDACSAWGGISVFLTIQVNYITFFSAF
jgi:hypothetical protein